jgi:hypothetical protein
MNVRNVYRDSLPAASKLYCERSTGADSQHDLELPSDHTEISDSTDYEEKAKWTIINYCAADNNLESYISADINEIEQVGSGENVNIVALLDDSKGCRTYHVQKDEDPDTITSPVIENMGDVNSADPEFLSDFLSSTIRKFPAENYAVIINSHGYGWEGVTVDYTSDSRISIPQLKNALQETNKRTGEKIDVLGFDACRMASAEVAYELKDTADYMIASQASLGGGGWNYTKLLSDNTASLNPREFAEKAVGICNQGQKDVRTLSVIDLSKMDEYGNLLSDFSQKILDTDTSEEKLKNITYRTQKFPGTTRDQHDFSRRISFNRDINDDKLKESAKNLKTYIENELITASYIDRGTLIKKSGGLSIEISSEEQKTDEKNTEYMNFQLIKDTGWGKAANKIKGYSPERN